MRKNSKPVNLNGSVWSETFSTENFDDDIIIQGF
jgi:hypothetical protein